MESDNLIRFPQLIDKPPAEDTNDPGFFGGITIERVFFGQPFDIDPEIDAFLVIL